MEGVRTLSRRSPVKPPKRACTSPVQFVSLGQVAGGDVSPATGGGRTVQRCGGGPQPHAAGSDLLNLTVNLTWARRRVGKEEGSGRDPRAYSTPGPRSVSLTNHSTIQLQSDPSVYACEYLSASVTFPYPTYIRDRHALYVCTPMYALFSTQRPLFLRVVPALKFAVFYLCIR
jgi:hypothetical protein